MTILIFSIVGVGYALCGCVTGALLEILGGECTEDEQWCLVIVILVWPLVAIFGSAWGVGLLLIKVTKYIQASIKSLTSFRQR